MCRRADVGLGNVRIPDSSRRYHRADTLALEYAIARINPNRAAHRSRTVTEWCAGALDMASEPLLNYYYYGCAGNGVNVQQTLAIIRAAVRMNIATSTWQRRPADSESAS